MENFEFPAQPQNPQENKEIMQDAVEKWETIGAIQARLKGDRRKIEKIVDTFRQSNPEYFEDRKVKGGPIREHVSPEIIKIIEKELEDFKNIPEGSEGWETSTSLSEKLGVVQKTIARIAESIRKEYGEHFGLRRSSGGGVFEYYSPELVKIIQEKVEKFKNIPEASEEWETSSSLSKKLNMGQSTIANLANPYRKTNPEYFEDRKDKAGKVSEHYSRELIKNITDEINKIPVAIEGWETNKSLSKELKIAKSSLKNITEQYRKTNPEYFEDRRHKDIGGTYEHYSPVFVDILRNKFDKGIDGKENWKSVRELAKDLETDYGMVARIAEQYRKTNPEYFEKLQDKEVGLRKHISPELVKIIQEKIAESKNTPSNRMGWETNTALAEELNVSFSTISNLANQYREANPEYFEISKDKMGNIREYYSTELVKIIQEKIREFKDVPMIKDGWKANRVLAEELGIHENTLKKIANQYRKTNPQYFEYQKRKSGGMFESYSPELVELLKKEIEKFKEVPEDYLLWSTNKALAKELEINEPFLAKLVSPYRETNPEHFKDFRNKGKKGGSIHEHYSPELINIIKEEINKENLNTPVVPEDWQSIQDISERLGISKEEVEKMAKKLRGNYPDGYGKFKKNDE